MKRLLRLILLTLGVATFAPQAQAATTLYTGQFLCGDRGQMLPAGGITVQLWRRGSPDFLPVEWVGGVDDQGFADDQGRFSLRATNGEDNHFVRMALRDAQHVHLRDFWGINDWSVDTGGVRNTDATHDYGGLLLDDNPGHSSKCAIWRGVHRANQEYVAVTGSVLPTGGGVDVLADAVTAGTPFTPGTTIMWPGGFPAGWNPGEDGVTHHEFGHVIRHGFDGDFGHFLGDVVTYNYAQNHQICNLTNQGFAFNEGWAEYWSREVTTPPNCAGQSNDNTSIEGNVAAKLADLETRCLGGSRAAMVNVLRGHPATIHSYEQFAALVPCLVAVTPPVSVAPLRTVAALTAAQRAALVASQRRSLDREISRLIADRLAARRRASATLHCTPTPCTAALERVTAPAVLGTQLQLAQLARQAFTGGDTKNEQLKLAKRSIKSLATLAISRSASNQRAVARIESAGLSAALRAAAPIFAKDKTDATRALKQQLLARLGEFRKAKSGGAPLPPAATLGTELSGKLGKVAARTFPNPEPLPAFVPIPTPTPAPLAEATVAFTSCPASSKLNAQLALGGTLTPAKAGTAIELTVTPPDAAAFKATATTDAQGAFTYALFTDGHAKGAWKVDAHYAGDATTKAADASPCGILIGL